MPQLFKSYLAVQGKDTYVGGKSKDEVKTTKKIYKLSSNENLLGPSPMAMQAMQQAIGQLNEYPEQTGQALQNALADFYKQELSPKNFITENSGVGIIEIIIRGFMGEGLECIVSNPAFQPYLKFPEFYGGKAVDVPMLGDNFELDVAGILNSINDNTRLVWLCSPNNPTGTHIPKNKVDELVAGLPDHVALVYDEVYYQFAVAEDFTTGLPYVLAGKNVIAINSFSKAYGLAGLRVGYAYTTEKIAAYLNRIRRPFLVSSMAMTGAMAALKDTDFLARTVQTVRDGRAYLYPELERLGMKYWKSQANFILIKPEMPTADFEELMLNEGIMVRPVANFGAPGCIRVTVGTREANEAFVEALEIVLRK